MNDAQAHNPKLVSAKEHFPGRSISEFYEFIRSKCAELSDADIENEMSAYLTPDEIPGLGMMFRAALAKL